jgi:hypothetical protein
MPRPVMDGLLGRRIRHHAEPEHRDERQRHHPDRSTNHVSILRRFVSRGEVIGVNDNRSGAIHDTLSRCDS